VTTLNDRYLIASLIDEGYIKLDYTSPTMDWLETQGYTQETRWAGGGGRRALTEAGEAWLKAEPRTTYFVNYTESYEVTREVDPNDSWDQGDCDHNGQFSSVTKKADGYNHKEVSAPTSMKKGILVWCQYASGCTFGSSSGHFDAIGFAYTDEGVKLLEKVAADKHSDYFGGLQWCYTETIDFDEVE
jgi:hypothetical protein